MPGKKICQPDESSIPGRRVARVFLVLYVAALVALAYRRSENQTAWDSLIWRPENSIWIGQVAAQLGSGVAKELLLYLGLSFLMATASAPKSRRASIVRVLPLWVLISGLSFGISLGVYALTHGKPISNPTFPSVMLMVLVCLWGSWLGLSWMRTRSALAWLFRQMLLVVLVICGGAAVLTWCAVSPEPLDIASATVSTADRRRLVQLFKDHDPRDLEEDEITQLTISDQDLNQLAGWGLSLLPGDHRVQLHFGGGEVSASLAVQLPPLPVIHGYLNLKTSGNVVTRHGELGFSPHSFKLGRLTVPDWLLWYARPLILGSEWHGVATEPFFKSLKTVEIDESTAMISYSYVNPGTGFAREALVGLGMMEDLEAATSAHVERLIALAERSPEITFQQCIETAFVAAKSRSANGNAARENRAAILALGYVLGHWRVRTLAGADVPMLSDTAKRRFRRVTLASRDDWTRHYTLSAALHVLSNALASLDLGLLKEELDADGESGFSFGDLLIDRAGTMLGVRATESESAATAMQNRIAGGFLVSDFIPDASGLPEGLTDAEFKRRYGGVGGEVYERLSAEIDQRVAGCPGYRLQND